MVSGQLHDKQMAYLARLQDVLRDSGHEGHAASLSAALRICVDACMDGRFSPYLRDARVNKDETVSDEPAARSS